MAQQAPGELKKPPRTVATRVRGPPGTARGSLRFCTLDGILSCMNFALLNMTMASSLRFYGSEAFFCELLRTME